MEAKIRRHFLCLMFSLSRDESLRPNDVWTREEDLPRPEPLMKWSCLFEFMPVINLLAGAGEVERARFL